MNNTTSLPMISFTRFAKQQLLVGVHVVKGADCLYSYPTILKPIPQKGRVLIGKSRESSLRPQFLVQQLKKLQNENDRIAESAFLEALFMAYQLISSEFQKSDGGIGVSRTTNPDISCPHGSATSIQRIHTERYLS
jgi:hypothetical protein